MNIEPVLLVFTIILLLLNIKEGRGWNSLILQVGRATRTLTRMEYFFFVSDAISNAQEEIIGTITGRQPADTDINRVNSFAMAIKRATVKGVNVKYVFPKFQDRIYVGYLYTQAGAEVRYCRNTTVRTMRYMVVDNKTSIIAIPESVSEKEMTSKGY